MNELEMIKFIMISFDITNLKITKIINEKYKYTGLLYYNEHEKIYNYNNFYIIDNYTILKKINDKKYIRKKINSFNLIYNFNDIIEIYYIINNKFKIYRYKYNKLISNKLISKVLTTNDYNVIKYDMYNGSVLLQKQYYNNRIHIYIIYENNKINYKKNLNTEIDLDGMIDELSKKKLNNFYIYNYKFNI